MARARQRREWCWIAAPFFATVPGRGLAGEGLCGRGET